MKNFKKIKKSEVKQLLNKALFKTFFHSLEWQDFLEEEFKWLKFEYWLYKKDEALLIFGKIGDKLISLPFCEYGGPLLFKEKVDFEEFKKDVLKEFDNIKIKIHPQILLMCEAKLHTLRELASPISTYWINLKDKSEKELLSSFRKTLRHSIKNSQKSGLRVEKCENTRDLKAFYNLCVANLKRKKTVPYPFSVIKFLYNSPVSELLLFKHKEKVIAGDMFLSYGKFVHYFISASDYKYRNLGANYLILWEKIKNLVDKDITFDLGASPKGSALEIFKRGWRGKEYPILQLGIKRSEEGLRLSKLRNIYGLLPNFVIKKLSSYLIKYRL